jgi:predicted protein tyrosine phosphatase
VGLFLDPGKENPEIPADVEFDMRMEFRFHDTTEHVAGYLPPVMSDIASWIEFLKIQKCGGESTVLAICHRGLSRSIAATAIAHALYYPREIEMLPGFLRLVNEMAWPNHLML